MKDLLTKLNVNYVESDDPMLHYIIKSELSEDDILDLEDCAIYVTKDGYVKIIIPNFHTVTNCDYFFEKYPDLYFSRPCNKIADIGTIFLEGNYGFFNK